MKRRGLKFVIFLLLLPVTAFSQSDREKVKEGNQLFHEEKYDEAQNKYQDALLDNPASPLIQFNIGDVQYKKKKFEKALEAYYKSLDSKEIDLQADSYYNIGNTLYKSGKLAESIQAYKQALKLNPEDEDAKYNLEFVRNKLKQNASNKNQQNQQQQQEQKQQKQQQKNKDQDKKDQQKEQQPEQQQEQQQGEKQDQQEQQSQEKKISKEEAERILQALKENQEKMKKKRVQAQGKTRVEKDW
ncbi:MAG: tetratricopeptide repeat protein [bacterium]